MEKRIRSFLKAVSWRIFATITTMCIVFAFTGNVVVSSGVSIAEFLVKIFVYYLHERLWELVPLGKSDE
ncbi:DUF2061 domain-containing protein [Candidatus Bathyarchaeota archaeon]|nr:DUF2061 domain-containing protein [Candidatus Bathyarchaeota archaeon]